MMGTEYTMGKIMPYLDATKAAYMQGFLHDQEIRRKIALFTMESLQILLCGKTGDKRRERKKDLRRIFESVGITENTPVEIAVMKYHHGLNIDDCIWINPKEK